MKEEGGELNLKRGSMRDYSDYSIIFGTILKPILRFSSSLLTFISNFPNKILHSPPLSGAAHN